MKKIFLDANIFIDIFSDREAGGELGHSLLLAKNPPMLYMSALTVHIAYYVSKVRKSNRDYGKIKSLLRVINLVSLDEKIVKRAMEVGFSDFEDTLQYLSAIQECDYLVTRDKKDFRKLQELIPSDIKIISSLEGVV